MGRWIGETLEDRCGAEGGGHIRLALVCWRKAAASIVELGGHSSLAGDTDSTSLLCSRRLLLQLRLRLNRLVYLYFQHRVADINHGGLTSKFPPVIGLLPKTTLSTEMENISSFSLPLDRQDNCDFFQKLPGEVRDRIYSFALSSYDDPDKLVCHPNRAYPSQNSDCLNSTTRTPPIGAQSVLHLPESITPSFRLASTSTEKPGFVHGPASSRNSG